MLREASNRDRAGNAAYLKGNSAGAVPILQAAAELHLAAGDLPGGAGTLLNLALAQRASGAVADASLTATRLRELTPAARQQARERGDAADQLAELEVAARWLDALLAVSQGDLPSAAGLLDAPALPLPAASPWRGRLETLRAELALAEGRPAAALAYADRGAEASAAAGDRAEQARALRLAGLAHMQREEWEEARSDFMAAVRIEEALGAGARMVGDLDHLAIIATHLGDHSAARLYERRARVIAAAR